MGKYDNLRYLKKTKARTTHRCDTCNNQIMPGEYYYIETINDKFLHSLHAKRFCAECYKKRGEQLLNPKDGKKSEARKSGPLNNFL
jgi:hypothetical protein